MKCRNISLGKGQRKQQQTFFCLMFLYVCKVSEVWKNIKLSQQDQDIIRTHIVMQRTI